MIKKLFLLLVILNYSVCLAKTEKYWNKTLKKVCCYYNPEEKILLKNVYFIDPEKKEFETLEENIKVKPMLKAVCENNKIYYKFIHPERKRGVWAIGYKVIKEEEVKLDEIIALIGLLIYVAILSKISNWILWSITKFFYYKRIDKTKGLIIYLIVGTVIMVLLIGGGIWVIRHTKDILLTLLIILFLLMGGAGKKKDRKEREEGEEGEGRIWHF